MKAAQKALENRRHVVVDRCNLTPAQRHDFIALARHKKCAQIMARRCKLDPGLKAPGFNI